MSTAQSLDMSQTEKNEVDPITLEIIRNSMLRTCEEMKVVVTRSAYSTVIYEVLDYSCGLFDAEGNILAEQSGIPIFLANIGYVIRAADEIIGFENLEPGDVVVSNDPYAGGSHLPDTTTILPIFDDDGLLGFAGFRAHLLDWGGKAPGGMFNDTTEIFQEGLIIPPVKLYQRGVPNPDVFRILEANNRVPRLNTGDLRALVSGSRVGAERVSELANKYGGSYLRQAFTELFDRGEHAHRQAITTIPDGVYRAEAMQDGTGDDAAPIDAPFKICLTITVKNDKMHVDFAGTADQLRGSQNVPYHATIAATRAAYKYFVAPEYLNNEGCFRPLTIDVPEGSMLWPKKPAPVSNYPSPLVTLIELFQRALADAVPERVIAGTFGDICCCFYYGTDAESGGQFISAEPEGGGYGAAHDRDGESALVAPLDGDTYNIPGEIAETKYPIYLKRYELIPDSGGPGRWRGGLGVYREFEVPPGQTVGTIFTFERENDPSWGLFDGKGGAPNHVVLNPGSANERRVNKLTDHWMSAGEVFSTRTGGGGGWGDPLEREVERVAEDVRYGFVTVEGARRDYGVVIQPDTFKVDLVETDHLRKEMATS